MNKPQHAAGHGHKRALRSPVMWTLLAVLFISWGGPAANGFWQSLSSSNFAAAKADTLPQGNTPAVSLNGTNVTLNWAAVTTPGGHAVSGYTVARYSSASGGTSVAAGGGCAGAVSGPSCVEQSVPDGTWYYAVRPVISLWTGTESARSAAVSIDTAPPTISVTSISPTPNVAGFNNTSPVTVNLSAMDSGSGVATIKYSVDGGSTVTVNAAMAAVNVSGNGTHTVSYFATDAAGNASIPQAQAVKIDTVAPTAPTISAPAWVNSASKSNVPVTGTAEAGATVTLTVSDGVPAHTVTKIVAADGSGVWNTSGLDLTSLNDGTISYSAVAKDAAGNTGPASTPTPTSTKDTAAPVVSSITMANSGGGGNAGRATSGDTLTLVYSADMNASTICSSWNSAASTQSASATVSISAVNDTLTLTGGSCSAPAFGSVLLNGNYNSHASQARTYAATMIWTKATGTLVITLNDGGTNGTRGDSVLASLPVYTPPAGAADVAGNPMTGTFTAGAASGF